MADREKTVGEKVEVKIFACDGKLYTVYAGKSVTCGLVQLVRACLGAGPGEKVTFMWSV